LSKVVVIYATTPRDYFFQSGVSEYEYLPMDALTHLPSAYYIFSTK